MRPTSTADASAVVTVPDVVDRLRGIDSALAGAAPHDGARVFNRMYLEVTERVLASLRGGGRFADPALMERLDVDFAMLWVAAYDAAAAGVRVPRAWRPLFERRGDDAVLPVQFALAGMNAHIEHDLPLAVVGACEALGRSPRDPAVRADYLAVNALLAEAEAGIRRSFLTQAQQAADREVARRLGPVVHLVSSWSIERARDLAWVSVETLWALRGVPELRDRVRTALGHSVGMTGRHLLTAVR